jgi:hypothetical protein
MLLEDQDAVRFLRGVNSVRDGNIVGLSILPGDVEWDPLIQLTFNVPQGTDGGHYVLTLRGMVKVDYNFTSEHSIEQIAFMKCLWTAEDQFYLSLDPWKEGEYFISEQDNDCFQSKSVTLVVGRTRAGG